TPLLAARAASPPGSGPVRTSGCAGGRGGGGEGEGNRRPAGTPRSGRGDKSKSAASVSGAGLASRHGRPDPVPVPRRPAAPPEGGRLLRRRARGRAEGRCGGVPRRPRRP